MDTQNCGHCGQAKPFEAYNTNTTGLGTWCLSCLNPHNSHCAEQRAVKLVATIDSLLTLDDFYSTLEAAKENETLVPFHSKGTPGVQTIKISSLGNEDLLELDPTSTGTEAFKALAERISQQCGDILGYRWR